jgi:uncharacterized membrane protein
VTDVTPLPQAAEDRTLPAVAYGLYLLGFVTGITPLIGLVIAYVQRDQASEKLRSHYTFLINTFWMAIGWIIIGCLLLAVGIPLSFILIGIPAALLGWAILALVGVWFAIRCGLGVLYLARDEAYPRPRNWLF